MSEKFETVGGGTHIDDLPRGLGVGEDVADELLPQIVIFDIKHLRGTIVDQEYHDFNDCDKIIAMYRRPSQEGLLWSIVTQMMKW